MGQLQPVIDTSSLPWQVISETLSCKVLSGDIRQGPHTMLLRSIPRGPEASGGQYHTHQEEFFCLAGDFTFDGGRHWFGSGSYAYFPTGFVHGTGVHVRGGYELYARFGGAEKPVIVPEPLSHIPYPAEPGSSDEQAIMLECAANQVAAVNTELAGWSLATLRHSPDDKGGALFVHAEAGADQQSITICANSLVELFVLEGEFAIGPDQRLSALQYTRTSGRNAQVTLTCMVPGAVLVSHDGGFSAQTILKEDQ